MSCSPPAGTCWRRTTYDHRHADGHWTTEQRETYNRGNGATILLYDPARRTVLLTRQFRFPVYVNGHPDGMLVEAAAGLLDTDDPATAIRRETAEELRVTVGELEHVFDVWMSPGSVTEQLHSYAAPYTPAGRHQRRRRPSRGQRGHRSHRARHRPGAAPNQQCFPLRLAGRAWRRSGGAEGPVQAAHCSSMMVLASAI